ncbi:MAG: tetratricopeptide repeat protein, partial [Desulfofustis sp.]|nr:tetratricopeptide repeat protein [Desulfofustis sp.]
HIIKNPADISSVTLDKEEQLSVELPEARDELHRKPNPANSVALADRGYAELKKGNLESARQYLMSALEIDGTNPYALINLGVIHEKEGDYPKAIEMYQKVIDTNTKESALPPQGYHGEDLSLLNLARQNIEHVQRLMNE